MQNIEPASASLLAELEQLDDLPSPPAIVPRIIELLNDPDSDFQELIDLLANDPALVAKILKTANSAMYARRREVTNLAQAMLTLGHGVAATLALSFSLVTNLQKHAASGIDLRHYWRRSLLTAVVGRMLGTALKSGHKDELFLSGLLQDIGLLVLDKHSPERYSDMGDQVLEHRTVIDREINDIGVDHAWIGAWLLEQWGLPEIICDSVRHSHDNSEREVREDIRQYLDCGRIACQVSDVLLIDQGEDNIRRVATLMEERLGMDEPSTLELLDEVSRQIPEIESQFDIDILDSDVATAIVDRARKILMDVSLRSNMEISTLNKKIDSLGTHVESLENEVHTDRLTGLRSREYMEERLSDVVARAKRLGKPLSLAFMDLDGFKAINDTFSHSAGDEVLRRTADLLLQQIREKDVVARFGGDEFMLLLDGETAANAMIVCKRIVSAFDKTVHSVDGQDIDLHISIGLATLDVSNWDSPQKLIEAADEALKRAKQLGKAQVVDYRDL